MKKPTNILRVAIPISHGYGAPLPAMAVRSGIRRIKIGRESQVILSQVAMDNVGKGLGFETGSGRFSARDSNRGSINCDGPDGKLDTSDHNNQKHSIPAAAMAIMRGAERRFVRQSWSRVSTMPSINTSTRSSAATRTNTLQT